MRARRVVTAFVERAGGEVLWLRRSSRVRTYPGHWGAVSGSIEEGATPAEEAQREIAEEAGLRAAVVREGPSFTLVDPAEGHFTITPVWCRVEGTPTVRLNWESDAFCWASAPPAGPCLPALLESWRRARGEAPRALSPVLSARLAAWRADRAQGASALAVEGALLLSEALAAREDLDPACRVLWARGLSYEMRAAHAAMAGVARALSSVCAAYEEEGQAGAQRAAAQVAARAEEARREIVAQARARLGPGPWATVSRSSLVEEAARAVRPALRVLQSLPLGEGESLAAAARAQGLTVELYPDACMAEALRGCSAAVMGADALLPGGDVLNKVGSFPFALTAWAMGVPVYVLAESSKRCEEAPPIPDAPAVEGQTRVPLFARVPRELIRAILTDTHAEAREVARHAMYLVWEDAPPTRESP